MDTLETTGAVNYKKAEPVQAAYELDQGPGRYRIGLIALASDFATERDFINMRPSDEVAVFVSRVRNLNPCTVENLQTMAPKLSEAVSLIIPEGRLDALAYSCTSGTAVIGFDAVAASIHQARPRIPVATPITAALAALAQFGACKVAVLTPYIDEVNAPIVNCLEGNAVEVVALTSFLLADDNDMAKLPPEAIFDAALEADRPDAEALFISCTAIRAVDVVERIEQALGKPVITANQALCWQALRFAGYAPPVAGYGRLLRLTSD